MERLIEVLKGEMSRAELMEAVELGDRVHFMEGHLAPALGSGMVEMTIPEKKGRNQRYSLTEKGHAFRRTYRKGHGGRGDFENR